ncbi:MAG TPA: divergent polysaccharide deacetylase family protein [Sulfuricurvum sp.]|nr:divergent polysaccharide deacetylase family protein [Sulfuricurvum sp.]
MHKYISSFRPLFSLKHITVFLSLLIMICIALFVGYFIGVSQGDDEIARERERTTILMEQIKEMTRVDDSLTSREVKGERRETLCLKKELDTMLADESIRANHEYAPKDEKAIPPPREARVPFQVTRGNAKLAIIMDDVSYAHDVKAIQSVGLPLIMSFLPPNTRHCESATLAQGVSGYMVHLPLEAVDFNDEEQVTLRITDTKETIASQIQKIKKLYPKVRYINNHTGSKFTADEDAMDRLVSVMSANDLIFVDSRTTAQSKAKIVDAKYGMRYIGRDVFLDHHDGVENIKKQIREAVAVAKRHGTAIAIGHPRPDTIQALKESKAILSQVQLVGIDKI